MLSWWSCQSPVAHGCGPLNHLNTFLRGTFKLNAKFDADSLLYLLGHFECDGHTVHMLTQWCLLSPLTSTGKSSLLMHVRSSPLSLAARLHQCHANCLRYINNGWTSPGQTLYSIVCIPHILFIYSSAGHSGCFHLWAVVSNAAVDLDLQIGPFVLKRPWTPVSVSPVLDVTKALLGLPVPALELECASRGGDGQKPGPSLSFPSLWGLGPWELSSVCKQLVFVKFHPVFLITPSRMIGLIQAIPS